MLSVPAGFIFPGSLLEVQAFGPYCRPAESNSGLGTWPPVTLMLTEIWEALLKHRMPGQGESRSRRQSEGFYEGQPIKTKIMQI